MKIRLQGTLYEVMHAVEKIKPLFNIKSVTTPVKEPGEDDYTVYLELK